MVKKDLFKKTTSIVLNAILGFIVFSNVCSASAPRRGLNRLQRQTSTTIVQLPNLKQTNTQPNNTQPNNISPDKNDNYDEHIPEEKAAKEEQREEEDFQRMIEEILK